MIKGMYRSVSGMLPSMKKQEAIANNLANASTSGYKKDVLFSRELSQAELKTKPQTNDWQTSLDSRVRVDHSLGTFDKTGSPLDLAIDGDGFFALQAPDGSNALTRSGSFVVDSEGFLAYPGGYRLLGEGGALQVGSGELKVAASGEVEVDGLAIGTIVPRSVADVGTLQRLGGSLFGVPQGQEVISSINATIQQGYKETSNVDVVAEMVDMIVSYREYEANAKALQTQEATLDHLFRRVAGS